MISEDFAFFGFDEASWDRLVSLAVGDNEARHGIDVVALVEVASILEREVCCCGHGSPSPAD